MTLPLLITEKTVLAGKYALEEAIGRGGMGTVYRATHLILGCSVAVKLLDAGGDAHLAERFLREAQLATAARHPNVVSIMDFGTTDDGRPFMVMEYLEGRSLCDYLDDGPALTLAQQVDVIAQVLAGLDAVHRAGIVHRDLKPANVFVTVLEDGSLVARLLDFGISFSIDPDSQLRRGRFGTDQRVITGTPEYMSVEQAEGRSDIDLRADLHSVGVILYELLSGGTLPYSSPNPGGVLFQIMRGQHPPLTGLRPDLPELSDVVERAIDNDRTCRPASASALRLELLDAFHRTAARAGSAGALRQLSEPPRGAASVTSDEMAAPLSASSPTRARLRTWGPRALVVGIAFALLGVLAFATVENPVLASNGVDSRVAATSVAVPASSATADVGSIPSTPPVTEPTPGAGEEGALSVPAVPSPRRHRARRSPDHATEIRRELDF